MSEIGKGSIVKFKTPGDKTQQGYYKVSGARGYSKVNLGSLFNEMLGDGNLDHPQRRMAFQLRMILEGDTRTDDGLTCKFIDTPVDYAETLYYAIRTCCGIRHDSSEIPELLECDLKHIDDEKIIKCIKNLRVLFQYIEYDEFVKLCDKQILREHGYEFSTEPLSGETDRTISGILLADGRFVECSFQDHQNLQPILKTLGLVSAGDWISCDSSIHISASEMSGNVINSLSRQWRDISDNKVTPEQIETLWKFRHHITGTYGDYGGESKTANIVRTYTVTKTGLGGKYGNLKFLSKYFPHLNIPRFSVDVDSFTDSEPIFIRTSPDKSLPGLLNSILTNKKGYTIAQDQIRADFEKVKDIRSDNQIHWFFQEFLEGANGVAHVRREPSTAEKERIFSYQVSDKQGNIVKGKESKQRLSDKHEAELKAIAEELHTELKQDGIQLEFVIHNDKVYIVQLRILEKEFEKGLGNMTPANAIITGQTFSSGKVYDINVSDILVIEGNAEDVSLLLGKKALIVTNDVEFSHMLALSKALGIPSIYKTGPVNFYGNEKVNFSATTQIGWVNPIYKE